MNRIGAPVRTLHVFYLRAFAYGFCSQSAGFMAGPGVLEADFCSRAVGRDLRSAWLSPEFQTARTFPLNSFAIGASTLPTLSLQE